MPTHAASQQVAPTQQSDNPYTGDRIAVDGNTPAFNHASVPDIKAAVCRYFSILPIEMVSHRRARRVARPRQVAMALCSELTVLSLHAIGQRFGGRDHTTVMHAIKVVRQLAESDREFAFDLAAVRQSLEGP
jgi:chromosomal replication initiator protein